MVIALSCITITLKRKDAVIKQPDYLESTALKARSELREACNFFHREIRLLHIAC